MHHRHYSDAEIEAVALGVKHRTLPKSEWTHAAHFAAALWLLRRNAAHEMPALIRAYNEATGVANTDTEGYHETITLASLAAARACLKRLASDAPLSEAVADILAGELGRSDWPLKYWSRAALFSVPARRTWLAPDIAAPPWPQP